LYEFIRSYSYIKESVDCLKIVLPQLVPT
jgi:hypothetical protein